jgi:shikimate kinase
MLLVLVGLPGSGKTTVGRQLARRLHLPFVDSDHAIENRLGCSVREYFEREGEDRFRDLESEVLADLCHNHQGVLSTGGGSVLRPINRERLREHGQVFYLRSSPEEVFRRLRNDQNRPLLQVADPQARLRELLEIRALPRSRPLRHRNRPTQCGRLGQHDRVAARTRWPHQTRLAPRAC